MSFCDMTVTRSQSMAVSIWRKSGENLAKVWLPVGRASAESWHLNGRAEERKLSVGFRNGVLAHLVGCKGDFATCSKVYTMWINTALKGLYEVET